MTALTPVDVKAGHAAGASEKGEKSGVESAAGAADESAAEPSSRRVCVLVLGMHRSGTSALTRTISLLGAALPKNVLGEGYGNETGHWEPARLVELDDEMLAAAGSRWDDFRAFDPASLPAARASHFRAEIIRALQDDYGEAPLIVLKEPRICRFAPLYIEILAGLGYEAACVLATRNPLAVAASLEKRDGISPSYAHLVWLRHVLDAEAATRGRRRSFVSYEGLMSDWRATRDRMSAELEIDFRAQADASDSIESFLSRKFTHHDSDPSALMTEGRAPPWLKDVYGALSALQADAGDARALAALDAARDAFEKASAYVGGPVLVEMKARGERTVVNWETRVAGLEQAAAARDANVAELRESLAARDANVAGLKESLAAREARAAELAGQAEDLRRQLAAARRRPLRLLRDLIVYRSLGFLLRHGIGVSAQTAAKWSEYRRKRDPDRPLGGP